MKDTSIRIPSYSHSTDAESLVGSSVEAFVTSVIRRHGEREALVSLPQRRRFTYNELDRQVQRVARSLLHLGVGVGDRVGIWSTDNVEWILLQLATARIGSILVNINPAYRTSELRHALQLAEVQHLFLIPEFRSSNYIDMACQVCPRAATDPPRALVSEMLPHLRRIVCWDPEGGMGGVDLPSAFIAWDDFLRASEHVTDESVRKRSASLDPDDPVNIQFTSGTTGFPKAVVLTHHNIVNNSLFTAKEMGFTEKDRLCVPLPFYHCFGMVVSNLVCLASGACIVIPADHFEAGATLKAIQDERCTAVHGVPTMFVAELDHDEFDSFDLSSLRTGIMAGAPCPPELMRQVIEKMGCHEILIGFGQTEASPITHLTSRGDSFEHRIGTVGRSAAHQECKVIDTATGSVQPTGEPGEVCIRGYNVMRGYFNQPDATRETVDEAGWLHTGDLGVMDADGYLRITGRLKDMIIRGGENIYPAEIEAFYYEHPAVEEIAVFGVPDEKYGEQVGAWVRQSGNGSGGDVDADSLREWAKVQIAHYKVPRLIWFVEEFPMTVTGKIQKNRIRDAVVRWLEAGGDDAPESVEGYVR